jgi:hypothetical protein
MTTRSSLFGFHLIIHATPAYPCLVLDCTEKLAPHLVLRGLSKMVLAVFASSKAAVEECNYIHEKN